MTRDYAKAILPLIQAYADGKTIQFQNDDGTWSENPELSCVDTHPHRYRIKPEPREFWLVYDGHGHYEDVGDNHSHIASKITKIIHVREVLPDVSGFGYPPQH